MIHWTEIASLLDDIDALLEQLPAGDRRQALEVRCIEFRVKLHADVRAQHLHKQAEMRFHNLEIRGNA
jgi:hypothetical protein